MKNLTMRYRTPAADSAEGWEKSSLPIGNGWLGANIFGIVERERVQLTHNALVNAPEFGGLNNLAEIYLHFPHTAPEQYERGLCLNRAEAFCRYTDSGVQYRREYFASYPDKVTVIRLTASEKGALSFRLAPEIPFLKDYALHPGDCGGKSGKITADGGSILLRGMLDSHQIRFECRLKVDTDGEIETEPSALTVKNASEATVWIAADTNYKLCPEVFLEKDRLHKCRGTDPHERLLRIIEAASRKGYAAVKADQLADYQTLFQRVSLSLTPEEGGFVPEMMQSYREGNPEPYLEELYFQYGRYLLISSSRKGGLPANLQGIWNCHDFSPWGSGYWHNINVQMNYWPAFSANLPETFAPYADFFRAYLPKAEEYASAYIAEHHPEQFRGEQGACGWTIGTAGYPYSISGPGGHSGPGTGALTSKLFWETYAFSQDPAVLKELTYPALLGMSRFLTKTVRQYGDRFLVTPSASPEQMNNGPWVKNGTYYQTVGCAFDQQMIYENGKDFLRAAELLGIENEDTAVQREQLDHYAPAEVGWSGQIKEYAEEHFYGEIGEYEHRHISQLMGLYPGTCISTASPAWMDAAKVSLTNRGSNTTGWALAHRLNAWARLREGKEAYCILRKLLSEKTNENLWDFHPPFQIDGNFGAVSGIAEMLLQSHEERPGRTQKYCPVLDVLPALPDAWRSGSISGLLARGGFEAGAVWKEGQVQTLSVKSLCGNELYIRCPQISAAQKNAPAESARTLAPDLIGLETAAGETYSFTFRDCIRKEPLPEAENFSVSSTDGLCLRWESSLPVNIYRAIGSQPDYTRTAKEISGGIWRDTLDFSRCETVTYQLRTCRGETESRGVVQTVHHASQLEMDRYRLLMKEKNKKIASRF